MASHSFTSAFLALLVAPAVACSGGTEPATTPLDLRTGPGDTAVIFGWIYEPAPPTMLWKDRIPIPGVTVELATWRGTALEFRDSVKRNVAAMPDDPRVHVVARTHTDASGRFRFGGVPKHQDFIMRALPPPGRPYRLTYYPSLFGLAHVDSANFPIMFERETP